MATCPRCHRRDTMVVSDIVKVRPLGTFSLAGNRLKFDSRMVTRMFCRSCGWSIAGYIDEAYFVEYPPGQTPETRQEPPTQDTA